MADTVYPDGTFIAYIKAGRGWDDGFIAAMRVSSPNLHSIYVPLMYAPSLGQGVCVITGLIGTVVMPRLEDRIGLERAGAWSIW